MHNVFSRRPLRRQSRLPILLVLLAALITAPSASGGQVARYWQNTVDNNWKGSRVTVGNPDSSQAGVSSGDFFLTSAYADSGPTGSSLIQVGVTYEYKAPEGPSCNLGSNSPRMYYFVEVEHLGDYTCYQQGYAEFATPHLQSVKRNVVWYSFIDSVSTGVTTSWTGCGGDACTLAAFGENLASKAGTWYTKFAGSGRTPWQFWNGCCWNTINSAHLLPLPTYWDGPSGPFPTGIWSFHYSH